VEDALTLQELTDRVDQAMSEGWSPGDEGDEFYTSGAASAVMRIPLIAAAPDLLELVQAIAADASAYQWHAAARAAIAKAEALP